MERLVSFGYSTFVQVCSSSSEKRSDMKVNVEVKAITPEGKPKIHHMQMSLTEFHEFLLKFRKVINEASDSL
uniref:COMM domain-containing protein n=1 Tax=Acrobeloides nanus TaxID=290746 RepID=A0A914EJN0_9BILA